MSTVERSRRLAAILAADVAGYTSAMAADETGTLEQLQFMLREVVRPAVSDQNGRIFKEVGDGFLVEFYSVTEAAECAMAIQTGLRTANSPLKLRIGLHVGELIVEGEDLFGDGVNIAARLQGEAEPGGVVVSNAFRRHAEGRGRFVFEAIGNRRLKGVAEPMQLHRIGGTGVPYARRRASLIRHIAVWVTLILAVALGVFWSASRFSGKEGPGSSAQASLTPKLAILPFDNLSPDPEQAFFAEGLAEDLITNLSKIEGIEVISRTSSFAYRDKDVRAEQLAEQLGVRFLVDGSVRRADDTLRITASLVDTERETTVWSERFEGATGDVFGFQDRITTDVIDALRVNLTLQEREALSTEETTDPAAFEAYLQGLRLLADRERLAAKANAAAQVAFEKAIRLDPEYALAYAGLGWAKWVYFETVNFYGDPNEAFELAERSLSIRDNALAHRILAKRHFQVLNPYTFSMASRDPEAAMAELEAARRLQPGNSDVLADLSLVLPFVGRPKDALDIIQQAMELNPNHPDWYFAASGLALLFNEQPEPAVRDLKRWVESAPTDPAPHVFLAAAYGIAGEPDAAASALTKHTELGGERTIEAVARRWPMGPREREIIVRGLSVAGLQ